MTMRLSFRIAIPVLVLIAASSSAQEKELLRLDFTEPQIVLTTGGRTGACDVMQFAGKGTELLAVGDDKVVHTWSVRSNGLESRPPLRWNVFRERRGSIYSLAVSPDERFAAVGGFGSRNSDVVVFDRKTGGIARALSAGVTAGYDARSTVWHLAFHADGDRIAAGLADGSVWVWTFPDMAKKVAALSDDEAYRDEKLATAAVIDRTAKVVWADFEKDVVRFARGDGSVWEVDLVGSKKPRLLFRFDYPIAHVVSPENRRWIAARPLVHNREGSKIDVLAVPSGDRLRTVKYEKNAKNDQVHFPVALATDAAGTRLAVGNQLMVAGYSFTATYPGDVEIYDLTPESPKLIVSEQFDGTAGKLAMAPDTIAFHPDGESIAIAGGHDHETALWRIDGGSLKRVGEPAISAGRGVWQVGSAKDGSIVTFKQSVAKLPKTPNDRGSGDWRAFDVTKPAWFREPIVPTERAIDEWAGWKIVCDPTSEFSWFAVHTSGFRHAIPIAKGLDDRPWCYTFLPEGDEKRVRLAVGHYWGFSLYEFGTISQPRRVMKGVGHHGYVASLAPAKGGKMLVSGSSDQTIGIWNLEPWKGHPLFGARIEWESEQQRAFVVKSVHEGSPAWEAGLLSGDRIAILAVNAMRRPEAEWEKILRDEIEPDRELAFRVERKVGDATVTVDTKTLMLTRPQARFFPTAGDDWVMYRYADHFYAASPNGDSYLGWQIAGKTAAIAPEFHPAARLREVFYRPAFVAESVARLLREPDRPLTRTFIPPAVTVESSTATVTDKPVTLTFAVQLRANAGEKKLVPLEKVELWLDDEVLLQSWPGGAGDFAATAIVKPEQLRVGANKLSVVGHARTRGEASVIVANEPPKARPALLRGLAVGVDKYQYLTAERQLTASANDARLMKVALEGLGNGKPFRNAAVDLLTDAEATPDAILAKIDELGKNLGPDDWFVIFLAGHGLGEFEAGAAVPRVKSGTWFYCAARAANGVPLDFATAKQAAESVVRLKAIKATITGDELLARLARLNCRKLVLLDACHSGAIALDPVRDLRPGGLGAVVLSASAPDESASEFDIPVEVNGKKTLDRHGFFSVAVFHALGRDRIKADRNGDGLLTLEELHRAVAAGVRDGRRQAGLELPGARTQTVLASPANLRNLVFVSER